MKKFPGKDEILKWISENPTQTSKRDIARAFAIKGAARIDLKRILKELEAEGHLEKRRRSFRDPESLPPVSVLVVNPPTPDGDLTARPIDWHGEGEPPKIVLVEREGQPALGEGDRILARLRRLENDGEFSHEARLIRRIDSTKRKVLGIFRQTAEGGRILPIEKGSDREWMVPARETGDARDGELVEAEQIGPRSRMGLPVARVVERLGDPTAPKAISLIAIHEHGIPDEFPPEVLEEAEKAKPAPLSGREDLRDLPLITIDPSDARDHDDACYAEPDTDPKNRGGHVIWVAIADVAWYVRPGTALDREAYRRGNSTYFPDRVVPMLPDRLSGDLCSLHEDVDRPVIAVRMVIDRKGELIAHRFIRAMMRSRASLHYGEVQAAMDGKPNARTAPLLDTILKPLYAAWHTALKAREKRAPLDLDLPERRIVLDEKGRVVSVDFRERLDAHKLIEEFMILANVAAAEDLKKHKSPLLYRVHEEPAPEKIDALREIAQESGFTLAKGQVMHTRHLNRLLAQAEGTEHDELINIATLRSMTQAYYHPENFGHFGLALRSYAHFTSPIRRYADLIVHRALISAHKWGEGGLTPEIIERLPEIAEHISMTERRSMAAERDTTDRYLAAYLAERTGSEFTGRIAGVARFGIFVKLDETGADGLVPIRSIGREYFRFDPEEQNLTGEETGLKLTLGTPVTVRLVEAVPLTGGLMLELLEVDGKPLPKGRRSSRSGKGKTGRKAARGKAKSAGIRKKASRKRTQGK